MNSKKIIFIFMVLVLSLPVFSQAAKDMQEKVENRRSDNITDVMKSIHFFEMEIEEIDRVYDQLWKEKKTGIELSFITQFFELDSLEPEIWETDREFQQRKSQEEQKLLHEINKEVQKAEAVALAERQDAKKPYEEWLSEAYENLSIPRLIKKEYLSLKPMEYQRNERKWPIRISSSHMLIPFEDLEVVVDFEKLFDTRDSSRDVRQELVDFDEAVRKDKLLPEIEWLAYRDKAETKFNLGVSEIKIKNELNGISYDFQLQDLLLMSAYLLTRSDVGNIQIERVSVISDIEPLFPLELDSSKPIYLPFLITPEIFAEREWELTKDELSSFVSISPANTFYKTFLVSLDSRDAFYRHEKGYYLRLTQNIEEVNITIKTPDGLFEENINIEVSGRGPTTETNAIFHEPIKNTEDFVVAGTITIPDDIDNAVTTKSSPSIQGNRINGLGVGLSAGYPGVNLDISYGMGDLKMVTSLSFLWDSSLLLETGIKFDIIETQVNNIPFYWNIGATMLLKQGLYSFEFGLGVPIGVSYYLKRYPVEIYATISPSFYFDSGMSTGCVLGFKYYE